MSWRLRSSRIRRTERTSEIRSSAANAVGRHCAGVTAAVAGSGEGLEMRALAMLLAYVITASKYLAATAVRRYPSRPGSVQGNSQARPLELSLIHISEPTR